MRQIETNCYGQTAWLGGEFYHVVEIYADGKKIDEKHVHCAEDDVEASCYAVSISDKLSQAEKEVYYEQER